MPAIPNNTSFSGPYLLQLSDATSLMLFPKLCWKLYRKVMLQAEEAVWGKVW